MWEHFVAEEVLAAIEEEKNTILYAVPTMINRLVELAKSTPPKRSSLRFCISGGASLPVEILHRFQATELGRLHGDRREGGFMRLALPFAMTRCGARLRRRLRLALRCRFDDLCDRRRFRGWLRLAPPRARPPRPPRPLR